MNNEEMLSALRWAMHRAGVRPITTVRPLGGEKPRDRVSKGGHAPRLKVATLYSMPGRADHVTGKHVVPTNTLHVRKHMTKAQARASRGSGVVAFRHPDAGDL